MHFGNQYIPCGRAASWLKIALNTIVIFTLYGPIYAQSDFVVIDSVQIHGLQRTKRNVVMKEIDLHPGDTISYISLAGKLQTNEKRLQSIGLFTLVDINIKNWNTDLNICNIEIKVQENWYIYPYLIFELADRNFNVWRKEQNYSFSRVNYGAALNHINLTGNKDKLKLKIQRGYTRKYEISYDFPYLSGRWGISGNLYYSENREIAFRSLKNKPQFYKHPDDEKVFFQHRASISLHHRTSPFIFQTLRLEYIGAKADSVVTQVLNPSFFGDGRSSIHYFLLDYYIKFDNTLYPLYPMDGYKFEFNIRKEGLGVFNETNNTWLSISAEKHSPILPWLILSNRLKIKTNLQNQSLPYVLNNAIGYKKDNLTGYQLYVLDGRDFLLMKNALRCRLFDKDFFTFKFIPNQFKVMNAKMFLRFSFDIGYSRDPVFGNENPYSNRGQFGYGPGVDIILFNNFTISCEYAITKFNERGLYFESGFNF